MTKRKSKKKKNIQLDTIFNQDISKPIKIPFITFFIIALLSGFIGGMGADFVGTKYNLWEKPQETTTPPDETNKPIALPTNNTDTEKTNLSPTKINDNIKQVQNSIIQIFEKRSSEGTTILEKVYLPQDILGQGFVLTSDGWIISATPIFNDTKKEYVAITPDNSVHKITGVTNDPITNISFFKLDVQNLPVSKFSTNTSNYQNTPLTMFNGKKTITTTYVQSLQYNQEGLIHDSENFYSKILLDKNVNKAFLGSPVTNSNGEILGIVMNTDKEKTTVLPMKSINPILKNIFKSNKPMRPYLGVNYLDLSELIGTKQKNNTQDVTQLQKGALIYADEELEIAGIKKDSPAENAGLKIGDVILKVENEEVI